MRYLTITYTVAFPNPAAKPKTLDHILLRTPDGTRFFHPEGGPSHFYLYDYTVHEDHGELDLEDDWDAIEALVLDNAREHWKPEKALRPSAGWLSPEGDFYPCEGWEHESTAESICRAVLSCLKGSRYLEEQNWIHVYDNGLCRKRSDPTQKQQDALFDLFELATEEEYKERIGRAIRTCESRPGKVDRDPGK